MTGPEPTGLLATRESLLERMKNRDDQASWQEFFDAYWKLIYGVARKAGLTDAEAQDAVQDTVLAVVRHIADFTVDRKRCSFKSWLMMIAQQRIIWQLRRRSPAGATPKHDLDSTRTATVERLPDPASLNLEAIWDAEWKHNLLGIALEEIKGLVSPRQLQIFDLYVLQEWPVADVARTLHISAARVYLAKHRVGVLLKRALRRLEAQDS
ncbi:MAG: RNA polymerase sigma factor [Verrucomicrobiia bacterium]